MTLQVGETMDQVTAGCLYHQGSKLEVRKGFKHGFIVIYRLYNNIFINISSQIYIDLYNIYLMLNQF